MSYRVFYPSGSAVSSDTRLCVLNIMFSLAVLRHHVLFSKRAHALRQKNAIALASWLRIFFHWVTTWCFSAFFFLPLGFSLQFVMLLCQVLLLHEKMGKTSCFQIYSSKWKHSPLSFHIPKMSTKKKKSPLAHVFLGNRLLILASSGMKTSLGLLFLDDHCFKSPCLSEYLSGMRTIF